MSKNGQYNRKTGKDGRPVRHGKVRIYDRIIEVLELKDEANTHEIFDFCNNYMTKRGRISSTTITMQALCNMLAKYPAFVRTGTIEVGGSSGKYGIANWCLLDWLEE
jgi:hypothetical protein